MGSGGEVELEFVEIFSYHLLGSEAIINITEANLFFGLLETMPFISTACTTSKLSLGIEFRNWR
jgi:hypothetical protein